MVELDWDTVRHEGVTFVSAVVTNTQTTPQTVRLESRLDGPVWPPRRGSVVRPEWDAGCWRATVRPSRSRGIGFASSAPPHEPPVEITAISRAAPDAPPDASAVLADLDGWAPTIDVLSQLPSRTP